MKRVFLIVLDSVGIGEMPDAKEYGDEGSNTLAAAAKDAEFSMEHMRQLGLFNIDGVHCKQGIEEPTGAYARMTERSMGKDTTIGHWEIAGLISPNPLPTYPHGFPEEILARFSDAVGRGVLCNRPYSGTKVIQDYGEEHRKTGNLIVYTSADSVFQIAAHEEVVPVSELYKICETAREILQGEHGVGRVIARPFIGTQGNFTRTKNRHDYSLTPSGTTMLNCLEERGLTVAAVGKIYDIFAGSGITEMIRTSGNEDGINRTIAYLKQDFEGLCFTNLVDYDMLYGHRNDVKGYAKALTYFDKRLPEILELLQEEDILMITADHGCDPSTESTDHSREFTPFLAYGQKVKKGCNLRTRDSFADIAATILEYFDIFGKTAGTPMPIWK